MDAGLNSIRVLTFDCYGTLINWERGILDAVRPWLLREGRAVDGEAVLAAFSRFENVCEAAAPTALYPDILRQVHGRLAAEFGAAATPADADALANSVGDWPPFDDTIEALRALKRRYRLVILSNVDRASFARTNRRLGVDFDAIITAEDVGSYKPAMGHFNRAAELFRQWGFGNDDWLHVAESLFHDHVPAKSLGLKTAWVYRRHDKAGFGATPAPKTSVQPDWTVHSLAELARLLNR